MASIRRRDNRESFRAWHKRKVGEREQRERQMDYIGFCFRVFCPFIIFLRDCWLRMTPQGAAKLQLAGRVGP